MIWVGSTMVVSGITVLAYSKNDATSAISTIVFIMGVLVAFAAALEVAWVRL